MNSKEQAKEMVYATHPLALVMASEYASRHAYNECKYQYDGDVSDKNSKKENDAWLKLKGFVEGLTEESK